MRLCCSVFRMRHLQVLWPSSVLGAHISHRTCAAQPSASRHHAVGGTLARIVLLSWGASSCGALDLRAETRLLKATVLVVIGARHLSRSFVIHMTCICRWRTPASMVWW